MSSAQVVKTAKEALDQAITTYKFSKSVIKKSVVSNEVPNERTFRNKLKALEDALAALNTAHTSWVSKSGLTDEQLAQERYSETWLQNEWNEVTDIQEQVETKLSSLAAPAQSDKDKLLICTNQMQSLQLNIERKVDNLHNKTDPSSEMTSTEGLSKLLSDVDTCLHDFSALADKIHSLDIANIGTNSQQFELFRQAQQKKIADIELRLATKKSASPKPSLPTKGIEMEKSKAPSFSGHTIDYPEFKRGWLKVPGVMWEDGNQVEQIKFKVNDHCRRLISRCSTMAEVWKTLDAEFAEEHEVINAVDEELRKLTSEQCSTPQYIVNLRNYLPTLVENLRSVGGVEHLCSPDRVHFMASKFDERTMFDWEYFKSKNTGTTYERFFEFLKDRYDASRATIARLKSASKSMSVNLTATKPDDTECHRCRSWMARDKIHTCPGCGRGTAVGDKIGHCLEHCGSYMSKSVDERSACVEAAGWCPVHLVGSHTYSGCTMANDPRSVCGINNCKKHHHKSLHGSTTAFVASVNTTSSSNPSPNKGPVLFAIQTVSTASGPLNCLFDNCSECCLITKDAAARLNLFGKRFNIILRTVTSHKVIESFAYTVKLIDNDNKEHEVWVHDVEYISNSISKVSLSDVKHLFDERVQKLWDCIDNRPSGEIDMLLGENYSGIHPTDWVVQGNLRIKSSMFGSGYVMTGSHPSIVSQQIQWNENVAHIRSCSYDNKQFGVNRISIKPMQEYFASDALGVEAP